MSFFAQVPTINSHPIAAENSSYTIQPDDYIIAPSAQASQITFTLPASSAVENGKIYIIKDESLNAITNNIVLAAPSGTNLNGIGAGEVTISASAGAVMVYNSVSSGWFTLNEFVPIA